MITRVSSVGVRAGDQDRAVEFYVGKLGFEKRRDDPMGLDGRWVELAPAGAETALVPFTPGLVFACDDIQTTFEELRGRGVEFTEPRPPSPGAAGPSSATPTATSTA